MQRILIVGSGAVGGFLGTRLVESGADVTFLVRPERQRQLMTRGIEVRTQYGRFRRPVHAVTPEVLAGHFDLAIVAARAQNFERAVELARPAIGPATVLMPVVEGIEQFLSRLRGPDAPRIVGAVFEGRVGRDADGVLSQRPPLAELTIGAVLERDTAVAAELAEVVVGRGMKTVHTDNIRGRAWQRFSFVASAIALCVLTGRPFRDAMPRSHHLHPFDKLLGEARRIGEVAGFPNWTGQPLQYRGAVLLESRPVQSPSTIVDGGQAGDEAAYMLAEMVGLSQRFAVDAPMFAQAWKMIIGPARDVAGGEAA